MMGRASREKRQRQIERQRVRFEENRQIIFGVQRLQPVDIQPFRILS